MSKEIEKKLIALKRSVGTWRAVRNCNERGLSSQLANHRASNHVYRYRGSSTIRALGKFEFKQERHRVVARYMGPVEAPKPSTASVYNREQLRELLKNKGKESAQRTVNAVQLPAAPNALHDFKQIAGVLKNRNREEQRKLLELLSAAFG